MVNAMAAVQSGKMQVNKAALEYGVPKMTLKDRRVVHAAFFPLKSSCS